MEITLSQVLHESLIQQLDIVNSMVIQCAVLNGVKDIPRTIKSQVLKHGVGRYCTANRWTGIRRGQIKQCYYNSANAVIDNPDRFIYMEGYAIRPSLGIIVGEHAWVLDRERNFAVIDLTWRETKGAAYLGIPFAFDYLAKQIIEHRMYGSLLDAYWSRWPITRLTTAEWLHPEADQIPRDFIVSDIIQI